MASAFSSQPDNAAMSSNVETRDTILVIEDDPDILELVRYNLTRDGFQVVTAINGEVGLKEAIKLRPTLIILDLMLPGIDGLSLCRSLRQLNETSDIPIVMLTAKSEESDVVLGLGLGADDYVTKPFSPRELVARVQAVLRRGKGKVAGEGPATAIVRVGPIEIDGDRHEVRVGGVLVQLTLAEFRLLQALMTRPGRVFTRDQLLDKINGGDAVVIDRNVDVHIRAIRKKLGSEAEYITTVRGVGYKCREA